AKRGFAARVRAEQALAGAARNAAIGHARDRLSRQLEIERGGEDGLAAAQPEPVAGEPLAALQWDMQMIDATPAGSYAVQQGSHDVLVGDIDTGIDASHPDLAPNFEATLSRNFTVDIPSVDGPCEEDPDGSCVDPANVDEAGHGTHTAGTIAAAANGLGIAGVAPGVGIVNLRAGQDSGFFFLQPTVDAITYAAQRGIDVVNMSFFTDPWLYNCRANPADSPAEQLEQATVIDATQRAVSYARSHGVTLIAALGNEDTDLGNPTIDTISPDFPPGNERERVVDNSCLNMPSEAEGVVNVSAVGPSGRKAFYSNYGTEQTDVSAPGGDSRDFFGTDRFNSPQNRILSTYPLEVLRTGDIDLDGQPDIDPDGNPISPRVVRDCQNGTCAYYGYLHGTSMAAPHAAGVAALIVAQHGRADTRKRGKTLEPDRVQDVLQRTAVKKGCPVQNPFDYPEPASGDEYTARCDGDVDFNGFYGHGIVNALNAVTDPV
ncbi:MAG TPA: S8 family serine peptidase, partial [Solirubrobacteraceae bacterium]|nr:S8 family serine peptidase [Solirubrobacteraceae bacterium]